VIFEDVAALAGLLLAAAGLALWRLTGSAAWDGLASIAVGALLVVVAASLARVNLSLIAGRAPSPHLQAALRTEIESLPGVEDVPVFVAIVIGPGDLLVAAKVNFADEFTAADIERVADRAEERLCNRFPGVWYVFLDPTPSGHGRPE
jgi:divalent metal cation (Fe/Co/Zn/Cd) transporter